jgi:hypothetical protein
MVKSRNIVLQKVEGSSYQRMRCSRCGTEKLIIEYGPLRRYLGKRQKGFFAICPTCPDWKSRITSGHRK